MIKIMCRASVFIFVLIIIACSEKKQSSSDVFEAGKSLGFVSKDLEEASGIAPSMINPDHVWAHNDSGHPAEIFLLNNKAEIVSVYKLKGITNRDFEDMSIGPGPIEGESYVYVGDIGDNQSVYPIKYIYRFREPLLSTEPENIITEFDTLKIKFDDGTRDAETLMIDPITKEMLLISKREDSVRVYQIPYPYATRDTLTAVKTQTLPFTKIVAGDISSNGKEVLLKDYDNIYYWKRENNNISLPQLLAQPPVQLKYAREPQGEAICWAADGSGFFTLSEFVNNVPSELLFYKRH